MSNSERQTLTANFQVKKANGLKDLKFFLGNVSQATVEEVCAEVNKIYAQVEKGNVIVQEAWGDSHRASTTA